MLEYVDDMLGQNEIFFPTCNPVLRKNSKGSYLIMMRFFVISFLSICHLKSYLV